MNARILVVGSSGQLARALRKRFPEAVFLSRSELDLEDAEGLTAWTPGTADVVINAAAYTAVDEAQTPSGAEIALKVNAQAPELLARACGRSGAIFVHISSDYVFDGSKPAAYVETDVMNPLGEYGKTKAEGDAAVEKFPRHYIVRTSWVIGEGNNFVKTMAMLAAKGVKPSVVNDQHGRLSFTQDIAAGIEFLLTSNAPFGTYNLTNEGPVVSWAEIAQRVFSMTGASSHDVTGVSTDEYFAGKENIAPRPFNSALDLTKIEILGFTPASWEQRLSEYLAG